LAFVDIKSSDEKETILRDEYDIELTRDMKEELKKMGGLMEPAVKFAAKRAAKEAAKKAKAEATAETKKQTLLENIRSLMESTQWTAQKAMDALKIPVDKQKEYSALI
jgi:hypothetical protein